MGRRTLAPPTISSEARKKALHETVRTGKSSIAKHGKRGKKKKRSV